MSATQAASPLDLGAQPADLAGQVAVLGGALDRAAQLGRADGLAQVVEGPGADGLDRLLDAGVGREQDQRQVGRDPADPADQIEGPGRAAVGIGQILVHQHRVVGDVVDEREGLLGRGGAVDLVAAAQQQRHEPVDLRLAVDHQHAPGRGRALGLDLGGGHRPASPGAATPASGPSSGSTTRAWVPTPSSET